MTDWINGTLDELDSRLRELKREVARQEQELAWFGDGSLAPEDRGLGHVHDLAALRGELARRRESEPVRDAQRLRRVSV